MPAWAGESSLQSITQREVLRREQKIAQADSQIVAADALRAKGDNAGAARLLLETWQSLPDSPMAAEVKARVLAAYAEASCAYALELLKQGRQKEAIETLDAVLEDDVDPHNKAVLKLKKHASDPDRYPPALSPEHIAKVEKVKSLLILAGSATDLGDFNKAGAFYHEVLHLDPYNVAARRELEKLEGHKAEYYDAARDQNRAKMLGDVSSQWESAVPPSTDLTNMFIAGSGGGITGLTKRQQIERKLRDLTFPRVEFAGASLDEVVEYLRVSSRNVDPQRQGISFVVNLDEETKKRTVAISVQNIPLEELLRYITEMTSTAYKVEDNAVILTSLSEKSTNLISKKYRVPPDFIQTAEVTTTTGSDPFAAKPAGQAQGAPLMKRMGAKEFLESRGVSFPEGSGANFQPSTSTLIVRNTSDNIGMIDTLVEQANGNVTKQAKISVRMVEVNQENFDELGADIGLGQANVPGTKGTFFSGGAANPGNPQTPFMSSGLRSSGEIIGAPGVEELLRLSGDIPPTTATSSSQFRLSGVFTDPQIDIAFRALKNKKGTDIVTMPTIVTKSGQKASIRSVREFPYPTEFDPPQIPQAVGQTQVTATGPFGSSNSANSSGPVIPATPTAFEKKELGVILEIEPNISSDGRTVEIALNPSFTEFEGFIDYGSDISNAIDSVDFDSLLFAFIRTPGARFTQQNDILQPVFKRSSATTTLNIYDGSTVVFAALVDERTVDMHDKVPVVGDIPLIGRLWQSKVKQVRKKCILFFVTVNVIDPAGQKLNPPLATTAAAP